MTTKNSIIGDIVAADFRTAQLFKNANIDFCCGGGMSLEDACEIHDLNLEDFMEKIKQISDSPGKQGHNYQDWKLDFLCDYIVNTHHTFVRENLPAIYDYTQKIADVHGDNHPELIETAHLFEQIKSELTQHLGKEEEVLFPAIKEALASGSSSAKKTLASEIKRMADEHEFAGNTMAEINRITIGYSLPENACNTYEVCFRMLAQFEEDLHVHVHLENNILFKKALEL